MDDSVDSSTRHHKSICPTNAKHMNLCKLNIFNYEAILFHHNKEGTTHIGCPMSKSKDTSNGYFPTPSLALRDYTTRMTASLAEKRKFTPNSKWPTQLYYVIQQPRNTKLTQKTNDGNNNGSEATTGSLLYQCRDCGTTIYDWGQPERFRRRSNFCKLDITEAHKLGPRVLRTISSTSAG